MWARGTRAVLYLHVGGEQLVRVPQARPVVLPEGQSHGWEAERTVPGDFCVDCLGFRRFRHGHVVIQQSLGEDVLKDQQNKINDDDNDDD